MTHLLLFGANFANIFLRAFQQRNVAHLHYWPVMPLSLMLAITDVYVIGQVGYLFVSANLEWHHILALALGGGIGCMCSMYIHEKHIGRKE